MEKVPANLLKNNSAYTHLQAFVDKQLKKQFVCELSENFVTSIVIKASSYVSAEFCTSRTCIPCLN